MSSPTAVASEFELDDYISFDAGAVETLNALIVEDNSKAADTRAAQAPPEGRQQTVADTPRVLTPLTYSCFMFDALRAGTAAHLKDVSRAAVRLVDVGSRVRPSQPGAAQALWIHDLLDVAHLALGQGMNAPASEVAAAASAAAAAAVAGEACPVNTCLYWARIRETWSQIPKELACLVFNSVLRAYGDIAPAFYCPRGCAAPAFEAVCMRLRDAVRVYTEARPDTWNLALRADSRGQATMAPAALSVVKRLRDIPTLPPAALAHAAADGREPTLRTAVWPTLDTVINAQCTAAEAVACVAAESAGDREAVADWIEFIRASAKTMLSASRRRVRHPSRYKYGVPIAVGFMYIPVTPDTGLLVPSPLLNAMGDAIACGFGGPHKLVIHTALSDEDKAAIGNAVDAAYDRLRMYRRNMRNERAPVPSTPQGEPDSYTEHSVYPPLPKTWIVIDRDAPAYSSRPPRDMVAEDDEEEEEVVEGNAAAGRRRHRQRQPVSGNNTAPPHLFPILYAVNSASDAVVHSRIRMLHRVLHGDWLRTLDVGARVPWGQTLVMCETFQGQTCRSVLVHGPTCHHPMWRQTFYMSHDGHSAERAPDASAHHPGPWLRIPAYETAIRAWVDEVTGTHHAPVVRLLPVCIHAYIQQRNTAAAVAAVADDDTDSMLCRRLGIPTAQLVALTTDSGDAFPNWTTRIVNPVHSMHGPGYGTLARVLCRQTPADPSTAAVAWWVPAVLTAVSCIRGVALLYENDPAALLPWCGPDGTSVWPSEIALVASPATGIMRTLKIVSDARALIRPRLTTDAVIALYACVGNGVRALRGLLRACIDSHVNEPGFPTPLFEFLVALLGRLDLQLRAEDGASGHATVASFAAREGFGPLSGTAAAAARAPVLNVPWTRHATMFNHVLKYAARLYDVGTEVRAQLQRAAIDGFDTSDSVPPVTTVPQEVGQQEEHEVGGGDADDAAQRHGSVTPPPLVNADPADAAPVCFADSFLEGMSSQPEQEEPGPEPQPSLGTLFLEFGPHHDLDAFCDWCVQGCPRADPARAARDRAAAMAAMAAAADAVDVEMADAFSTGTSDAPADTSVLTPVPERPEPEPTPELDHPPPLVPAPAPAPEPEPEPSLDPNQPPPLVPAPEPDPSQLPLLVPVPSPPLEQPQPISIHGNRRMMERMYGGGDYTPVADALVSLDPVPSLPETVVQPAASPMFPPGQTPEAAAAADSESDPEPTPTPAPAPPPPPPSRKRGRKPAPRTRGAEVAPDDVMPLQRTRLTQPPRVTAATAAAMASPTSPGDMMVSPFMHTSAIDPVYELARMFDMAGMPDLNGEPRHIADARYPVESPSPRRPPPPQFRAPAAPAPVPAPQPTHHGPPGQPPGRTSSHRPTGRPRGRPKGSRNKPH